MKKVFLSVILAVLVAGGVFGQLDNSSYIYSWDEYQGREETPSGIRLKGERIYRNNDTSADYYTSDGVYEYYDCYVVGSFGYKGGNPAEYGPLYDKDNKRSFADFSHGSIPCVGRNITEKSRYEVSAASERNRYAVKQIWTGPNQRVAIMTSQEIDFSKNFNFSENVRLLIIQPDTKVEFNRDRKGLILISGEITDDKNIKRASSLDEVMSTYAQVKDNDNFFQMTRTYEATKALPGGNNPDSIAYNIISMYAMGTAGFNFASGMVMPIWLLPLKFANAFGTNLIKASMAYSISLAYGTAPKSDDEFKYDLYVLLAGEDMQKLLTDVLKAASSSGGTEILSKEVVLEKIEDTIKKGAEKLENTNAFQAAALRLESTRAFQGAVVKTMPTRLVSRLALKGLAKKIPVFAAVYGAKISADEANEFGRAAMHYYTDKAMRAATDLPTNVNVVFQTAKVPAETCN